MTNKVDSLNTEMHSSHDLSSMLEIKPTTPMVFILLLMLATALTWTFFFHKMKELGFTIGSCDLAVDENLPDFFAALKMSDK